LVGDLRVSKVSDYVDSHDFDLWKENGYAEFLKRTSYDPQGRRALIAKQRAEKIARTAEKKLDTLDNLLKRHYDDRTIIFTANNEFAYEISQEFVVPCITHQTVRGTVPKSPECRDWSCEQRTPAAASAALGCGSD
jgi:superfamily II DNA or RNA helicase